MPDHRVLVCDAVHCIYGSLRCVVSVCVWSYGLCLTRVHSCMTWVRCGTDVFAPNHALTNMRVSCMFIHLSPPHIDTHVCIVIVRAGSRCELRYPSGVTHVLSRMAGNSTEQFEDKDHVLNAMNTYGGSLHGLPDVQVGLLFMTEVG